MFCPGCGKEVKNNAEFCPNCGKSLKRNDDNKGSKKIIGIAAAILAVLVLVSVIVLVVNNISAGRYNRLIDKGNNYLDQMDYDDGIVAFDEAIQIDPKRPEAYEGKVNIYIAKGDYESALAVINDGLGAIEGDDYVASFTEFATNVYDQYADLLVSEGKYSEALEVLKQGNDLMPGQLVNQITDVMMSASDQQKAEDEKETTSDADEEKDLEAGSEEDNSQIVVDVTETYFFDIDITNITQNSNGTYDIECNTERCKKIIIPYEEFEGINLGDTVTYDTGSDGISEITCCYIENGIKYFAYGKDPKHYSSLKELRNGEDYYYFMSPDNKDYYGDIILYFGSDTDIYGYTNEKYYVEEGVEVITIDGNCAVRVYYDESGNLTDTLRDITFDQFYQDYNSGLVKILSYTVDYNESYEITLLISYPGWG